LSILDYGRGGIESAVGAILAVPLLIAMARSWGLVDRPGGRKHHFGDVPLVGGLAIYASLAVVIVLGPVLAGSEALRFTVVAGAAAAAGLADDIWDLRPIAKLALQFAVAALAVFWGGHGIAHFGDLLGGGELVLGGAAPVISVLGYVGLMNAMNLIDGADGVAGCVSSIILAGLIALAAIGGARIDALPEAALGAILGFLVFNMPWPDGRRRASAFLGDAGSLLIGVTLGWVATDLNQAAPQLSPILLVWVLAFPIIDMAAVACARLGRGESPFRPGRNHLHHLLLDRGVSPCATALAIGAIVLLFVAIALAGAVFAVGEPVLLGLLLAVAASYGVLTHRLRQSPAPEPRLLVTHRTGKPGYRVAQVVGRSGKQGRSPSRRAPAA